MGNIPRAAESLIQEFVGGFTRPTFPRFVILLFAAILTTGRRTVTNLLRTVHMLAPGHPSSYHRVFSKRRWRSWRLAQALASFIIRRWAPEGPIPICGDDTVDEHRGKKVYGKGCHRDAVRSTHSFTAYRWGHKWVVLSILVKFPGRWSIETTFQEMRAYLGLETTRGWSENTVLRMAPSLFGQYSVVALLYADLQPRWTTAVLNWPGKRDRTFSDAITAVRRWLWTEWAFATPQHHETFSKLSRPFKMILLDALAPAA